MMKLESKIFETINKYSMLSDGDNVVVAVSGGADSMCLLHFFNKFLSVLHLNSLVCAHVNHGIRGAESDRDEAFVKEYCEKNSIAFVAAHYDVPAVACECGESLEQCGRRLRYEFLRSLSKNGKIATAHNLNDSAETFLFNLARGTGLKGLTGISAVRDNIIRPLSECTREEIEEYLHIENVDYVTDSTNFSDDYSRNKIRHNVLPVLSELNSGFYNVFLSCINTLEETEKYLSDLTELCFRNAVENNRFRVSDICGCDEVIKKRLLIKIAEYYGAKDIEKKHILLLSDILVNKGAVMLHSKLKIVSDGRYLFKEQEFVDYDIYEKVIGAKEIFEFPSCTISFVPVDKDSIKNYNRKELSVQGFLDADKLTDAVFRSRNDGDRFRYPGATHSKSLKNLYKENNISKNDRWGVPLLADAENILWIDNVGVSEYACITEETKNISRISIIRKVSVL